MQDLAILETGSSQHDAGRVQGSSQPERAVHARRADLLVDPVVRVAHVDQASALLLFKLCDCLFIWDKHVL